MIDPKTRSPRSARSSRSHRSILRLPPILLLLAVATLLLAAPAVQAAELLILDSAGRPVAEAAVTALLPPPTSELAAGVQPRVVLRGRSDEEGRVVADLPVVTGLVVLVEHPAHALGLFELGAAAASGRSELRLQPGRSLSGTALPPLPPSALAVATNASRPAALQAAGAEPDHGETVQSQAAEADGNRPATPTPTAAPAGSAAPTSPATALAGEACAAWTETRLPWLPTSWRRCSPLQEDGSFRLAGLPAGEVDLEVRAAGYVPARLRVPTDRPAVVRLEAGVLLTGLVTDPQDRPLAGASVQPVGGESVESGADGRFAVVAPALPVALHADAPGHQAGELLVRRGKEGELPPLHLRLPPGAELVGQVVAPGELPAEIELRLERFEPPARWTAETRRLALADGGAFRADLARPGLYRLRLRAAGHRDTIVPELDVPVGVATDLGALLLQRGAGVAGWVSDGDSGEPLAGVDLEAVPQGARLFEAVVTGAAPRATSGEGGEFLLPGLAAGAWEIRLRRAGSAPAAVQVTLAEDAVEDLGEVVMSPGVEVSGRVTDRAGNPRPGLAVRIHGGDGDTWTALAESHTDDRGRFDDLRLAPGSYRVRVEGERPLLTQALELGEDERERELELVAGGVRLAGRVLRGGAPVAGGSVTLLASDDPGLRRGKLILHGGGTRSQSFGLPTTRATAELGADGHFEVEDAPSGWVEATVQADGTAAAGSTAGSGTAVRRLHVPDREEAWIEIDLDGETLSGRVLDAEDGRALEARVAVYRAGAPQPAAVTWSRADGSFDAAGLEAGSYDLEVTRDGYAPGHAAAVALPAAGGVTLELVPSSGAGSLVITLADAAGRPLPAVSTQLVDAGGRSVRSLLTGPDGRRRFDDLPAGSYRLVWSDPAMGVGVSPPLEVDGGLREVRVVAREGAPLLLGCEASACDGLRLDHLAVYSPEGLEVAAHLPGADAGLRLVAGQAVSLGRLAPGAWTVDLVAAGERRQQSVVMAADPVVVPVL